MNNIKKLSGAAIATAAATMILSGCQSTGGGYSEPKSAEVHCHGINACKGTSACATATSSCKGQNSCKGIGWLPMTEAECDAKGGTVKG